MNNYTGKKVYVGLDIHKHTYFATSICEGEIVKRDSLKASPEKLVEYLQNYFPGAKIQSAYEAGFSGFHLHRYLIEHGIDNKVIPAAAIEISARDRVKTDKRDSLKIALQLAAGRLVGIYVPSVEREAYRTVTRLRETFVNERKRRGNLLKSLLFQHGFIQAGDKTKVTSVWIKKVLQQSFQPDIQFCIQLYAQQWLLFQEKIKEIDAKLKEQAKQDADIDSIYRSVPGIGATHARILANELEDTKRFKNEKALFSFTGLTPCEYSSGDNKRQGHISRQGRAILRRVLTQAAWIAIKYDNSLKQIFERMAKVAGSKRAIIGIARRLIGRIRACFHYGEYYRLNN